MLLQISFNNFSIIGGDEIAKTMRSKFSDEHQVAWITINGQDGIHMVLDYVTLKFITCGGEEAGHFSLFGYISAFDSRCWLLINVAILAFLLVLQKCGRSGLTKIALVPLRVLLEQGIHKCSHISCKYVNLVRLVAGVVLSNAYKWENITDLSSPVLSRPVKEFQEMLAKNFTVYSPVTDISSKGIVTEWVNMLVNNGLSKEHITNMYQNVSEDVHSLDTVFDSTIFGTPEASKWNPLIHTTYSNKQVYEILEHGVPEGYLRFIRNCDKTAFVDWSDQIQESRYVLKRLVREKRERNSFAGSPSKVSISIDGIGEKRASWGLSRVKLQGEKLFRRISIMVESGIARQWKNWEQRVKTYTDMAAAKREPVEFRVLQVGDNIVVVFYTHLAALAATVAVCVSEIGPTVCKLIFIKIRMIRKIRRFRDESGKLLYQLNLFRSPEAGTVSAKITSRCIRQRNPNIIQVFVVSKQKKVL